jgi:hypothetical protein
VTTVGVSIQLVSPASGDEAARTLANAVDRGFHSISFPSEWGLAAQRGRRGPRDARRFHSISFPSEWGRDLVAGEPLHLLACFHSISFPSEWGQLFAGIGGIRLGSFHSISFPSEWGHLRR